MQLSCINGIFYLFSPLKMSLETNKTERFEEQGDHHEFSQLLYPIREDAFEKSDEEKMTEIAFHFQKIMETLGLDLTSDSLEGTPYRFAKMYVKELFSGLNPINKPSVSIFSNSYSYSRLLIERNISFTSFCEHHFLPMIGKVHVAYQSTGKIIGLSKINRIVRYYASRPQVQERLTEQIAEELKEVLSTKDVIIYVEARHLCVSLRGVKDPTSDTITTSYSGIFNSVKEREEFFKLVK